MMDDDNKSIENINNCFSPLAPYHASKSPWHHALTGVLSEQSRIAYRTGLLDFARFILNAAGKPVPDDLELTLKAATPLLPHVTMAVVTEYREHLFAQSFAASTINLRLAALNSLFKRMQQLGDIISNPASATVVQRIPPSRVSSTEGLTHEEAESLLYVCSRDQSLRGYRDTAIVSILLHNGLRRAELVSMDSDKFKMVGNTPTYLIIGKNKKETNIEIIPSVWTEIQRWRGHAEIADGPLFRAVYKAKHGNEKIRQGRLTTKAVWLIIKNRTKNAGITKRIHPHSLRHTFATLALLNGVHIQDLQIAMGHSKTDTTFRYYRAVEQIGRSPGRRLNLSWQDDQQER